MEYAFPLFVLGVAFLSFIFFVREMRNLDKVHKERIRIIDFVFESDSPIIVGNRHDEFISVSYNKMLSLKRWGDDPLSLFSQQFRDDYAEYAKAHPFK